ncbi:TetR/AcrR family transcriptional regulator [Actinopolyspora mzabensis]|uniref:TetR/AcrR family transcriptional regulator n=1 Tax=Actinopolyspora mzabensis TaxID=995066 RepID=UPI001C409597|nr:TetR/AcrR family transcriptional regulator [Actinopolyspora mzabensis]
MLISAEHVLSNGGLDEFTVAAVAEHAGVSVGAIYRRFTGKEQLLKAVKDHLVEQLEIEVAEALSEAPAGLRGIIGAFTHAVARTFSARTGAFPELLSGQSVKAWSAGSKRPIRFSVHFSSPLSSIWTTSHSPTRGSRHGSQLAASSALVYTGQPAADHGRTLCPGRTGRMKLLR